MVEKSVLSLELQYSLDHINIQSSHDEKKSIFTISDRTF